MSSFVLWLVVAVSILMSVVSAQSGFSGSTNCTAAPTCTSGNAAVPPAWYNLSFPVDPSTVNGGVDSTFTYLTTAAGDSSCGFQHHGMVGFNGTSSSFLDLNVASGGNSSGYAIPGIIGGSSAGSVLNGTYGWSFEVTIRSSTDPVNGKVFALGAGAPNANIFFGPDGSGTGMSFGIYNQEGTYIAFTSSIYEIMNPVLELQWYHLVFVTQTLSATAPHGNYFLYVNGVLLTTTATNMDQTNWIPFPTPRPFAYLAKSDWSADPYWTGLVDSFRIYNYALTQAQVTSLYQSEMGGCPLTVQSNPTITSSAPNAPALPTGTAAVTPMFSLTFSSNPLTSVTGASGYGWVPSLSTDTAVNQTVHTGLINLNASSSQFLNLSSTTGPNSVGVALPIIGGGTAGWTFEVTVYPVSGADAWSKIFDLGSTRNLTGGNCVNDIVLGWDGSAAAPDTYWQFCICDNSVAGNQWQTSDAMGEVKLNQWSHMVAVIQPLSSGLANYYTYINGQIWSTVNNAFYPVAAARQQPYLGKSNWADPYFNGYLDTFNIYNQALSSAQIANLYTAAMVTGTAAVAASSSSAGTATVAAASSSSAAVAAASSTGTAAAGAVSSTGTAAATTTAARSSSSAATSAVTAAAATSAVATSTAGATSNAAATSTAGVTSAAAATSTAGVTSTNNAVSTAALAPTSQPTSGNGAASQSSTSLLLVVALSVVVGLLCL